MTLQFLAIQLIAILVLLLSTETLVIATNSTDMLNINAFTTDNTNFGVVPQKNKQVLCRPRNKNKLAVFILDHFNRARVLLRRPAIGSNLNEYNQLMLLYKISQFYHFNKRVTIFHTPGKVPIGYAQILKCASQNILQNIGTVYGRGMCTLSLLLSYLRTHVLIVYNF